MRTKYVMVVIAAGLLLSACDHRDYGKQTYPCKGQVLVDGQPVAQVSIMAHDVKGFDRKIPSTSAAMTDANGNFEFSTFERGDGLPVGEYTLTFRWTYDPVTRSSGPDKFEGRYGDEKASTFKVTVEAEKQLDPLRIELTTK